MKTPPEIVARLADEIARAVKTRTFADRLPEYELVGDPPAEFSEFLRKGAAISMKIIAESGAKAD